MEINFTTQIWQEGKTYVSYAPELDVSSCGDSVEEARRHLAEAVEGFLEAAREKGTLREILEESGFTIEKNKNWRAPDLLAIERVRLAV